MSQGLLYSSCPAVAVATHAADPFLTLISGITSSDMNYNVRRSETQPDPSGDARAHCFTHPQKDYQVLLHRRARPRQVRHRPYISARGLISVPPAAPKPKSGVLVAPATHFIRKPVFKNTPSSPLHSVVESSAAERAVSQALEHSLGCYCGHLPDLFKSTGPPAPVAVVQKTAATVNAAKPTLLEKIPTLSSLNPQRIQAPTKEVAQ